MKAPSAVLWRRRGTSWTARRRDPSSGSGAGSRRCPRAISAFFAEDPEAAERLSRERALLDLLGQRISGFAVPAVEHASPDGRLQVRRMVEGDTSLGGKAREPALATSPTGRRFAGGLGRALAELHGSMTPAEAEALGVPARGLFHQTAADLRQHLSGRLPEPALEPVLDAVLEGYAALDGEHGERVLTHGDMGLHNIAIDPVTGSHRVVRLECWFSAGRGTSRSVVGGAGRGYVFASDAEHRAAGGGTGGRSLPSGPRRSGPASARRPYGITTFPTP
jgi:hypothetical protein